MAWTAPMTAVSGATFTAAAFNTNVRDNLNETAPAKATGPSQLFVSTGANAIATRVPSQAYVNSTESVPASASAYSDLSTVGPLVSVVTGTIAIVCFSAEVSVTGSNTAVAFSVAVSGASTIAASDAWRSVTDGIQPGNWVRSGMTHVFSGLTPGVNTFTLQYRSVVSGTSARYREISVIPL